MAAHRRRKAVKPKVQKERKPGEPTKEQSCQTCRVRKTRCSGARPACDQCIKAAVARGAREEDVKCHYSAASIYAKHGDSEFEARLGGREAKCDWGEKRKESVEAFEPKKEEEVVKVAMRPRMGGKTLPGVSERKDLCVVKLPSEPSSSPSPTFARLSSPSSSPTSSATSTTCTTPTGSEAASPALFFLSATTDEPASVRPSTPVDFSAPPSPRLLYSPPLVTPPSPPFSAPLPAPSLGPASLNQSSFPSDFSPSYLPTDHSLFSLSATLALRPPIPPWARAATLPLFSPSSCGLNPPYVATTASFWDGGPLSPDEVRGWEGLKYAAVQSGIRGGV